MHSHAPGSDFHGNVVSGNRIGTNNLRTDVSDPKTTGIYLASGQPADDHRVRHVIGRTTSASSPPATSAFRATTPTEASTYGSPRRHLLSGARPA